MAEYQQHRRPGPGQEQPPRSPDYSRSNNDFQREAAFSNIFGAVPGPGRSHTMTSSSMPPPELMQQHQQQARTQTMGGGMQRPPPPRMPQGGPYGDQPMPPRNRPPMDDPRMHQQQNGYYPGPQQRPPPQQVPSQQYQQQQQQQQARRYPGQQPPPRFDSRPPPPMNGYNNGMRPPPPGFTQEAVALEVLHRRSTQTRTEPSRSQVPQDPRCTTRLRMPISNHRRMPSVTRLIILPLRTRTLLIRPGRRRRVASFPIDMMTVLCP
ncbi:hypothetical protein MCOR02_000274 [Pyricularia oryzae]|nr:hypothetical protein MCOR02_000274 [Pyricularia oryzae]